MTSMVLVGPVVYMTAVFHSPPGPDIVWKINRYETVRACEADKARWTAKKPFDKAKLTCGVEYNEFGDPTLAPD